MVGYFLHRPSTPLRPKIVWNDYDARDGSVGRLGQSSLAGLAVCGVALGIGAVLVAGLWLEAYLAYVMPVVAGGFIYVAVSNLIPELHRSQPSGRSWFQGLAMLVGMGLMFWLAVNE